MSGGIQSNTGAKGRGLETADAGRAWAVVGNVNGPTIATPSAGPALSAVDSRTPLSSRQGRLFQSAGRVGTGCQIPRNVLEVRQTTKGRTARQPSPRWFSSSSDHFIEPSHQQGVAVLPVLFGNLQKTWTVVSFFGRRPASHGDQYVTQSPRKIGVCAFHRLGSINNPVPEVTPK